MSKRESLLSYYRKFYKEGEYTFQMSKKEDELGLISKRESLISEENVEDKFLLIEGEIEDRGSSQ